MATLLIVEDSVTVRHLVKHCLEEAGIMEAVYEAGSGAEALHILKMQAPDVILTCMFLPDIEGLALLRTIRALPACRDLPVIVLTGKEDVATKVTMLDNGASDYLIKPFDHSELVARVNVQLKIKTLQDQLKQISITDFLTGLYNRRHFMKVLSSEFSRSARYQQPLCYITGDIDFFKRINDTQGHSAGDAVLVSVSEVLKDGVRAHDTVARLGGEEFGILLPMAAKEQGLTVAERLRTRVKAESQPCQVTISLGVAIHPSAAVHSPDDLMRLADRALYAAKEGGRNCVAVCTDDGIRVISSG